MSPEDRSLLEKTYKLAEENNIILMSIRRSNRISMAVRAIYWIVIIGLSVGALYFIQPYIDFLFGALSGGSKASNVVNTESINLLQDLLK